MSDDASPPGPPVLTTEAGQAVRGPSAQDLERALRGLRDGDSFAILERGPEVYLQTAIQGPGSYVLEYRDGSPARHFAAYDVGLDEVVAAFQSYARGEDGWRTARTWERLTL